MRVKSGPCRKRRARLRKRHVALLLDRGLRQEMALESARDLLLGRALRRLREGRRYLRLSFASWGDYVAERLGCELRWAQYLVRMDVVLERFPELRQAVAQGLLSPLKVIHLSRLLTPDMPAEKRETAIAVAARLSVRQLEQHVRHLLAEDRARTTLAHFESEALESPPIPNPWDPGPGSWLSFPASGGALTLFEAASEVARRLTGDNLPRHACLEYMVADRFSAIGWSPELDQDARADEQVRRVLRLRAEDRARAELGSIAAQDSQDTRADEVEVPAGPSTGRVAHRFQRKVERLVRTLLTQDLDPDSTDDPFALDQIVQRLEALDRDLRSIMGELLLALNGMEGYTLLGWSSLNEYCQEGLGMDPRRAARLMRFREGLDRFPALAAAYHAGKLRYLQVLELMPIVVQETAAAWAEWAARSSVRHTREVVNRAWILALSPARNPMPPERPAKAAPEGSSSAGPDDGRTTFAHLDGGEDPLPAGTPLPPPPGSLQPVVIGVDGDQTAFLDRKYYFRIFLPGDLADFVRAGLRSCRDQRGLELPEGEALATIAAGFLANLDAPEIQRLIELFPTLERDGWQCSVETCTCKVALHEHHIRLLSQGGPDVESNKTSLCFVHHIILLHGLLAAIGVSGTAPDQLEWRLGLRPGAPPLLLFRGHRRIDPVADFEAKKARLKGEPPPSDPIAA
jgi:hypothetical protein